LYTQNIHKVFLTQWQWGQGVRANPENFEPGTLNWRAEREPASDARATVRLATTFIADNLPETPALRQPILSHSQSI
jgi:hypothetical protein